MGLMEMKELEMEMEMEIGNGSRNRKLKIKYCIKNIHQCNEQSSQKLAILL